MMWIDCGVIQISIHAPVKGATFFLFLKALKGFISIHAPVKGATSISFFNDSSILISIHAPVKGATALNCTVLS